MSKKEKLQIQTTEPMQKERSFKMKKENTVNTNLETTEKISGEVITTPPTEKELENYEKCCASVTKDLNRAGNALLSVALKLYNIYVKEIFRIGGYTNIYDMAFEKFGLSRGSCNNYLNICKKFGAINEKTGECKGLLPEYQEYSHSKLAVMRSMPKDLLCEVTPDMSVRQIINLKSNGLETKDSKKATADTKKTNKKNKKELLNTADITDIFNAKKDQLIKQIEIFTQENPDIEYKISVTLTY